MTQDCLIKASSFRLHGTSGRALIRVLGRIGYSIVRQRGSHVTMRIKISGSASHQIVIPNHSELDRGKLNSLLTEVSIANGIPKAALVEMI